MVFLPSYNSHTDRPIIDDENEIGPQNDRSRRSRRQEDAGGSERSKRRRKIVNQNASGQVASYAFELISNAVVYSCFLLYANRFHPLYLIMTVLDLASWSALPSIFGTFDLSSSLLCPVRA